VRAVFLSDVHANLPALRAALAEAERLGADLVAAAGDLVGGGPHPAQVVAVLRERDILSVRGNVDRKVVRLAERGRRRTQRPEGKRGNYAWTARQLEPDALRWLGALPERRTLSLAGAVVELVHGSPLGDADYVYPSITPIGLAAKLGDDRPDALVCGHSHVPFVRSVGGVLVVNCGAAGRPVDGDPRGALAVLDADGHRVRGRIVRFAFPVEEVIRDIERLGVPGTAPDEYRRGVKHSGA
jgi:predicted phosphodiesterase